MNAAQMVRRRLVLLSFCLVIPACGKNVDPKDFASDVPKLTRAVQAEAYYSGRRIADDSLVAEVFAKKPELKEKFQGVKISVKTFPNAKEVVVLVHSGDGRHCWFEDGSWTPHVDRRCYEANPSPLAEFTLTPPQPTSSSKPATTRATG